VGPRWLESPERPTNRKPLPARRTGAWVRAVQALVGAVLSDYDHYDASLNSLRFHGAHAITRDLATQDGHKTAATSVAPFALSLHCR